MKKPFTLFIALTLGITSFGQSQTVTSQNLTPTIGTSQKRFTIYLSSSPGLSNSYNINSAFQTGINCNWDITDIPQNNVYVDTIRYISVSDAQDPSLAPNADFVKNYGYKQEFITINDSTYNVEHEDNYTYDPFNYNPLIRYNLNMEYGKVDSNTFSGIRFDTYDTIHRDVQSVQEVVGEGTLTIPQGTLEGCLKIRTVWNISDSNIVTQDVSNILDTVYYWFSPYYTEPVAIVDVVYLGGNPTYYCIFLDMPNLSTEKNILNTVSIYPNPSNGVISIKKLPVNCEMKIIDISGRLVLKQKLLKGTHTLDLDYLEKGSYQLTLEYDDVSTSHKIILQ